MYTVVALWYGAGVALIGWRVIRRFGGRGLVTFIGIMGVYGPIRDYGAARWSGGGVATAFLNIGQDLLGHAAGRWYYPFVKTPHGPVP